ncbi:TlpA family protein disulfide reductase [Thalassotalea sp. PLHSN55]|uniref:TlpA family protein disulfide reductase n=1 Tax=Thalassotalea sp. PLHSN55 TaxID=3435888 RepID=UPI003F83C24D
MYFKPYFLIITVILSFAIAACSSQSAPKMLVGETTANELLANYNNFAKPYQRYQKLQLNESSVKSWPEDLHIDVFFGTWCHDSVREVPKFLALMNANPQVSYRLIGLNYNKLDPHNIAQTNKVKFTPTFVVTRSGREIGRIVEYTAESYIKDINAMLKAAARS